MSQAKVYFIGAGPGDPELITLKAKRLLENADVILYDFLTHASLLFMCKKNAKLICVGKKKGHHIKTQDQINNLIKKYTVNGATVLRLKGGDPTIFGRSGEEMEWCRKHKIPYEIVPGVTSAIAVPAYAGIPLTHRDLSRSVAFLTGTLKTGEGSEACHIPDAETLVVLMSVTHLEWIVTHLLDLGRFNASTPAALIYKGTTSSQKTVLGTLKTIVALRDEHKLTPPCILVVGSVARLAKTLDWRESLPLAGTRMLICRAAHQLDPTVTYCRNLGADVIPYPLLDIVPNRLGYRKIGKTLLNKATMVLFTSVNAVQHFFEALRLKSLDARILFGKTIMAIGPKTDAALASYGVLPDSVPDMFSSEGIMACLDSDLSNEDIVIPSAEDARDLIPTQCRKRGATVTTVSLYKKTSRDLRDDVVQDNDWVLFSSPSIVDAFYNGHNLKTKTITAVCIGPLTAKEVRKYQRSRVYIATEATMEAMVQTVIENL